MQRLDEFRERQIDRTRSDGEIVRAAALAGWGGGSVLGASIYSQAWLVGAVAGAFASGYAADRVNGYFGEVARQAARLLLLYWARLRRVAEELVFMWNSGRVAYQWDKFMAEVDSEYDVKERWGKVSRRLERNGGAVWRAASAGAVATADGAQAGWRWLGTNLGATNGRVVVAMA